MLAMLLSFAVPAMADDAFAVTAETVETPVAAGTTSVDVPLTLTANPGVACVNFQVTYDTALRLTAGPPGRILPGCCPAMILIVHDYPLKSRPSLGYGKLCPAHR